MEKREKLKFEVHLTEHCNLNCKGCFHFSNIAEPEFLDILEYEKDLHRLSALFGGEAELILLLGGEPLLHKDINRFLVSTREYFGKGKIGLVTNGILLPSMDEKFWEICRDYNITLMPTKYPIKIDFASIETKAEKYHVVIDYFNDTKVDKTLSVLSIDNEGHQDFVENFNSCYRANFCITLEHGRLYSCIMPAHFRHYIKKYNLEIGDFKEDGIDIYKAQTAEEIQSFLTRPMKACAYCNRSKWRDGIKWEVSKQKMEEWQ